jgi:hypothetical protein
MGHSGNGAVVCPKLSHCKKIREKIDWQHKTINPWHGTNQKTTQNPINHVDRRIYCHGRFIRCHICNSALWNKAGPRTKTSKIGAKQSLHMWQMQISRTLLQCAFFYLDFSVILVFDILFPQLKKKLKAPFSNQIKVSLQQHQQQQAINNGYYN